MDDNNQGQQNPTPTPPAPGGDMGGGMGTPPAGGDMGGGMGQPSGTPAADPNAPVAPTGGEEEHPQGGGGTPQS